jgi:D-alanyl-D-alanine carboxypeptidase/D-alanyl-D-alanine-endopeptidase (penicillin-binding protein 4)
VKNTFTYSLRAKTRRRDSLSQILIAFLCVASLTSAVAAQSPQRHPGNRPRERADIAAFRGRVERILSAPEVSRGYWGLFVQDADTGEVLFAQNADRYFLPASNAKLFTAALALATLGPDYRFRTTIESLAAIDANGALQGDLVLIGRGDPNLSNRKVPFESRTARDGPPEKILAELADAVAARGVKQITGDVIADDSYFSGGAYPSGWAIDDMLWNYGVPVSAIEINDGTLFIEIRPGERSAAPATYTSDPLVGIYQIHNFVSTDPRGSEQKLAVERDPGSTDIFLRGTIPLGAPPHSLGIAIDRPAEYAAALLKNLLEARGIQIYGHARARHAQESGAVFTTLLPSAPTVLAEHISQPLSEALRVMDKISQNLHAELLLRTAAREKLGDSSADAAIQFEEDFRKSIGLTDADAIMTDASGLSRKDMLTPQSEVMLLRWAAKQPWFEIFRASLPVAGVDGTLTDRMAHTPAAEHIWAKTGSLSHVDSLAGYATATRGAHLVFSFMANNHNLKSRAASDVLDALAVAMIEDLGAKKSCCANR